MCHLVFQLFFCSAFLFYVCVDCFTFVTALLFIVEKGNVLFQRFTECEADDATTARLPYEVWHRLRRLAVRYRDRLTVKEVAGLALKFTCLWFVGNLGYQEALNYTSAGMVNVLSSTSALFTLLFASVFPSTPNDRFTLTKLCLVAVKVITNFSIGGVVVVTVVDEAFSFEHTRLPFGALWAIAGALGYASYLVFLRRSVDNEEKLDIPMFFGFVGLFCMTLLWPVLYLLHSSGIETFYPLPTRTQLLYIMLNGLIGTVVSEYLWLWSSFLTNSLIATLALSLTVPMTVVADAVLWEQTYPWQFYIGVAPILLAFFGSTLLARYDNPDPVYDGLRLIVCQFAHIFSVICRCCTRRTTSTNATNRYSGSQLSESTPEEETLMSASS